MVLTPRLDLRQSQALVMTPQLQQAIKLLQLNNIELTAFVEQELQQNPLLEREGGEGELVGAEAAPEDPNPFDNVAMPSVDMASREDASLPEDHGMDVDVDNTWNHDSPAEGGGGEAAGAEAFGTWSGRGGGFDDSLPDLEQTAAGAAGLRDHLLAQVGEELDDPADRLIAANLIEMLDEAGYVPADLSPVAEALDCAPERVEATLALVQRFDPPGIFARSLRECLALQLEERNRLDPAMATLLGNLDLVARRDMAALMRRCGVDAEDIVDMIAEIRALNPKPALAFDHELVQPVTPDILMRPGQAGGWIIELNSETLPRVLVNNSYYAEVSRVARSRADKQYITECLQSANWLVKSLHQRATTILKVATELVRQQDAFFAKGVSHLRPLVLRDIAEAIDMHESTVSRVTSNKYMATPRGIFELKYFFTTAIASAAGGDAHSAESVRYRIKSLIDNEPADAILSDDKLVDILRKEGIDIARRTVAKYREAMRIPSSVQRRREKRSAS